MTINYKHATSGPDSINRFKGHTIEDICALFGRKSSVSVVIIDITFTQIVVYYIPKQAK